VCVLELLSIDKAVFFLLGMQWTWKPQHKAVVMLDQRNISKLYRSMSHKMFDNALQIHVFVPFNASGYF